MFSHMVSKKTKQPLSHQKGGGGGGESVGRDVPTKGAQFSEYIPLYKLFLEGAQIYLSEKASLLA